jgi:threonine dehydrogenase-like Zn-dependent dehydrogenase
MRAVVLDRELRLRPDHPDPAPAGGESIVRVTLAGICGTDLELGRGYMSFRGVPGHEFVGWVESSGDPALRGRRVVGEINASCGRCSFCAGGHERHCPNRTVLGIAGRDGAFADFLRLPDRNLHPLPAAIADDAAVFVEPIAAAYEILAQLWPRHDRPILVLGDGRLGALVAMVLSCEQFEVVVAGHHPEKLARLSALGLRTLLESQLDGTFGLVVDCTGDPRGFRRALDLTLPRGTLVLKSTAAASGEVNLAPVVVNEVTVVGSRCGRFEPALAALAAGKIDPCPLISAVYPLDEFAAAFRAASTPPNFKVLLRIS